MRLTDADLVVATQIAYYDFDYDLVHANGQTASIRELLAQDQRVRIKLEHTLLKSRKQDDPYKIFRAEHAIWLYEQITALDSYYGDWIVRVIRDDNEQSGFYACLLEVEEGQAIIAIRGSESSSKEQVEKDWIEADLGLLNAEVTGQQLAAAEFMEELYRYYRYEEYVITGHSLGGNLALHAAVTAPAQMKPLIKSGVSFDGPGFSDEYMQVQREQILSVQGKLVHYQWSLVGNLLFPLPGSRYQSVRTKSLVYENYQIEALLQKHDTGFVRFTEAGAVIHGDMDRFACEVGKMTRSIENCPSWFGNFVIRIITAMIRMPKEERKVAAIGLLNTLGVTAVQYPVPAVLGMTAIGALLLIGHMEPDFFGKNVIPVICRTISDTLDTADMVLRMIEEVLKYTELKEAHTERILGHVTYALSDMMQPYELYI